MKSLFFKANLVAFSLVSFLAFASTNDCFAQKPEELLPLAEPVQLFNGKDVDDWIFFTDNAKAKKADVWSVSDGVLKCAGKPAGYLQTKRWYRDYELELQWRWPGEKGGNSGVLVHTSTPLVFFGWPKSMEVQLQAASAGDFWVICKGVDIRVENESERRAKPVAGNQHTHRRVRRLAGKFEKPVGEWNKMRVICSGDEVKVFINGQLANHGTNSTVTEGAIALQSEGTPIEFKDISIKPLANSNADQIDGSTSKTESAAKKK